MGGHGDSSHSLSPAAGARLRVAISGCPSRGGYFGVQAVPASGNVARKGEDRRAQGPSMPPISPPQADGADSSEPARTGHHPCTPPSVPFPGQGHPKSLPGVRQRCRAMALARERGRVRTATAKWTRRVHVLVPVPVEEPVPTARPVAATGAQPCPASIGPRTHLQN